MSAIYTVAHWYPGDIRSVTELVARERAAAAREHLFQHELAGLGEPDEDVVEVEVQS